MQQEGVGAPVSREAGKSLSDGLPRPNDGIEFRKPTWEYPQICSILPYLMAAEIKKDIELEIAHVLFVDIVGYSKLLINEQRRLLEVLNQMVRETEQF